MKYFLLRLPSDPAVIGVKNGIAQVEIDGSGFSSISAHNKIVEFFQGTDYWSKESFVPDFDVHFEYVKVLKNANITDFLSFRPYLIACPFMVSQKVVEVFQSFNIQNHFLYPVTLFKGENIIEYYKMFYCPFLNYDIVDFAKSSFFTGTALLGKKYHSFKSKAEYLEYLNNHPLMQAEKLVLNATFDNALDFFSPRIGEIYISDRLREAIKTSGLSGINILEPREPAIETV